jgi:hypothetical protein
VKNGANCSETFSVVVEDRDVGDLVRVSWYVDYDATTNPSTYGRVATLENPNGEAIRPQPAELLMNFSAQGNPLGAPGNHVLEALVHDRPFDNRGDPLSEDEGDLPRFPSYGWFITVETGDCL